MKKSDTALPGYRTHTCLTAIHEAGHAVAALQQGFWVAEVRVAPADPESGHVLWRPGPNPRGYRFLDTPGNARAAWDLRYERTLRIMHMQLAGPLAEAKAQGKPLRSLGGTSDLIKCRGMARNLYDYWRALPPEAGIAWPGGRIINQTRDKVRRWLGQPKTWQLILEVASELARTRYLGPEELGEIVGRMQVRNGQRHLWADGFLGV